MRRIGGGEKNLKQNQAIDDVESNKRNSCII